MAHPRMLNQTTFLFLFITSLFIVKATAYQGTVCCRKAARLPVQRPLYNHSEPWKVCSLNATEQYPDGTVFPSVNVTLGWCKENCPGMQRSNLQQWLQPLATWIAPYIALLLLCPIAGFIPNETEAKKGDALEHRGVFDRTNSIGFRATKAAKEWFWKQNVLEYMIILGDPASALAGAFSEILSDCDTIRKHEGKRSIIDGLRMQMVILAGDTDFTRAKKLDRFDSSVESLKDQLAFSRAIRILNEARLDFLNAVFLPVVLTLAVIASVFHDAYTKLGDNDTAHGLAFGVWFSWLLVLAVVGNCFATSVNPLLTRTTFEPFVKLSKRRVPLRERYINSQLWDIWLKKEHPSNAENNTPAPDSGKIPYQESGKIPYQMWVKMLGGQFLGWSLVGFTSACAAAISYTTPTVGLGCRSFTFLLYSVLALAISMLRVGCNWGEHSKPTGTIWNLPMMFRCSYWPLVTANALVMVVGTIFHLAGVFRSCRCKLLFVPDSYLVEVNSNTALAVDNAMTIWFPIGYIAFGITWIICAIVIAIRAYVTFYLEKWDKGGEQDCL